MSSELRNRFDDMIAPFTTAVASVSSPACFISSFPRLLSSAVDSLRVSIAASKRTAACLRILSEYSR